MSRLQILGLAFIGILAAGSPLLAHHSWPVSYSKQVTVKGTVTAYKWENPHVMFNLDVMGPNGKMEKWNVGGPSTSRMAGNGWTKETLKPGDTLTAIGYQFSDGQSVLRLEKVMLGNGKEMLLYGR